eukprot:8346985-Alexandrium_andersonii.AAC.1
MAATQRLVKCHPQCQEASLPGFSGPRGRRIRRAGLAGWTPREWSALGWSCLLYTSDAADDM